MQKAYVGYLAATTGTAPSGVTTQTWTGSSPIKFSNPNITSYSSKTYRIAITLADTNSCRSSKYTYYVKQVPCLLRPMQSAADTSVLTTLFNPPGGGSTLANTITVYNKSSQTLTINSITLEFGSLGSGHTIKQVVFTTGTVTSGATASPTTVTAPGGTTVAANGSTTIRVDYNYTPLLTPLTGFCVTYPTST